MPAGAIWGTIAVMVPVPPTQHAPRSQRRLSDLGQATTVLALLGGATASTLGLLFSLVVLLGNWVEPGCTIPEPVIDNTAYCAINGDDYARALPAAALTLLFVVLTTWVSVRVIRRHHAAHGSAREIRWQVGFLVATPVLAVVALLAVAAIPLLRESL